MKNIATAVFTTKSNNTVSYFLTKHSLATTQKLFTRLWYKIKLLLNGATYSQFNNTNAHITFAKNNTGY